jgi:hypothetical protein
MSACTNLIVGLSASLSTCYLNFQRVRLPAKFSTYSAFNLHAQISAWSIFYLLNILHCQVSTCSNFYLISFIPAQISTWSVFYLLKFLPSQFFTCSNFYLVSLFPAQISIFSLVCLQTSLPNSSSSMQMAPVFLLNTRTVLTHCFFISL